MTTHLFDSAPALAGAVMFHGASMLPRLRTMTRKEVSDLSLQACVHNMEFPLHMATAKDKFDVPLWSDKPLSGAQVIALMVTSLWMLCNEDEHLCGPLVERWPIREMVALAGKSSA